MWRVPAELCKSYHINDRGTDVAKDDDPQWLAVQNEYWAITDRIDEIAWSLIDRPPTTLSGMVALMRYAKEHVDDGFEWPTGRHQFENGVWTGCIEEPWESSLIVAIADGLTQIGS
jgi:hypothetical protein